MIRAAVQALAIAHGASSYQTVTVSVGVASTRPNETQRPADLIEAADAALYVAKRQGRNRICLPVSSQMVTKTSHYTQTQLEKLATLAKETGKTEAHLLREGLDDLLRKYEA